MTDRPVELDAHRGMAAQKATDLRRRESAVAADQQDLRARLEALENHLFAGPAADWPSAVEKARFLIGLFAAAHQADDPRVRRMVADLFDDFDRLLATRPAEPGAGRET